LGQSSEIEFIIDPRGNAEDRQAEQYDWYMETFGGGVMILELEPKEFGRLFLRHQRMLRIWCSSPDKIAGTDGYARSVAWL